MDIIIRDDHFFDQMYKDFLGAFVPKGIVVKNAYSVASVSFFILSLLYFLLGLNGNALRLYALAFFLLGMTLLILGARVDALKPHDVRELVLTETKVFVYRYALKRWNHSVYEKLMFNYKQLDLSKMHDNLISSRRPNEDGAFFELDLSVFKEQDRRKIIEILESKLW